MDFELILQRVRQIERARLHRYTHVLLQLHHIDIVHCVGCWHLLTSFADNSMFSSCSEWPRYSSSNTRDYIVGANSIISGSSPFSFSGSRLFFFSLCSSSHLSTIRSLSDRSSHIMLSNAKSGASCLSIDVFDEETSCAYLYRGFLRASEHKSTPLAVCAQLDRRWQSKLIKNLYTL